MQKFSSLPLFLGGLYCIVVLLGSAEDYRTIYVNGELKKVTENLWQALYYLRCTFYSHPGIKRLKIWADALCINQADNEERNHQVQLMRSIYADSRLVITWLGEGADGSDYAFDCMNTLSKQYPSTEMLVEACDTVISVDFVKPLLRIAARKYWTRLWIIQEIALGDVVLMCGAHYCSWDTLALME